MLLPALAALLVGSPSAPFDEAAVLKADLERLALPLVLAEDTPGLVLAWRDAEGARGILALGRCGRDDDRPMPEDAVFEIGSLTKLVTGACLARAVVRGELDLERPLDELLPAELRNERRAAGPPVRLGHVATHTAGFPEIPDDLARDLARFTVDYGDYGEGRLRAWLAGFAPRTEPGATYLYSNAGFGVLGWLLARRAGTSYAELVESEIAEPLGLASTAVVLTPGLAARYVPGHDPNGDPVPPSSFAALAGCGGLRSDARDLLTLLDAFREAPAGEGELARALELATTVRHPLPSGVGVALAWNLAADGHTYLHTGQTAGFSCFVSFDRRAGTEVVVLANGSTTRILELGVAALRRLLGIAGPPLAGAAPLRRTPAELEPLVGRYASPVVAVEVTRDADRLYARIPGQPAYRLTARGPLTFAYRTIEATVDFELGEDGRAAVLVLHQNGRDFRCKRRPD